MPVWLVDQVVQPKCSDQSFSFYNGLAVNGVCLDVKVSVKHKTVESLWSLVFGGAVKLSSYEHRVGPRWCGTGAGVSQRDG